METEWHLAKGSRCFARTTACRFWPQRDTYGSRDGQPKRQKHRKRGPQEQDTIGYDAGKRVKGRKRHLLVDTNGLLLRVVVLRVVVHSAALQDRDGAKCLLKECKTDFPQLQLIQLQLIQLQLIQLQLIQLQLIQLQLIQLQLIWADGGYRGQMAATEGIWCIGFDKSAVGSCVLWKNLKSKRGFLCCRVAGSLNAPLLG
jgi:hypothetical protein